MPPPAPTRSLPAPAPAAPQSPPLPADYLATFEPRLAAAADDGERVAAVVDAIFALAADAHWAKLANVFLQATVEDDLAQVNQLLFALFNLWGQNGATLPKEKTDAAIRAVNTSWDIIVTRVCAMADKPTPETHRARLAEAEAKAGEHAATNGQTGPSTPSTTSSTPSSGDTVQA
jgi:hypothetical protein